MSALQLTERFNTAAMDKLLRMDLPKDDLDALRKYKGCATKTGEVVVLYNYADHLRRDALGRLYGVPRASKTGKGRCMQTFSNDIRGALLAGLVEDVDVKNCHPVLLIQYMARHGKRMSLLQHYVNEREAVLAAAMEACGFDRAGAKTAFLALIYLGGLPENAPHFMQALRDELRTAADFIKELHPKELAIAKKKASTKEIPNPDAGCMAHVLHTIEFGVMTAVVKSLQAQGYSVTTLIHDGCHVALRDDGTGTTDEALRAAETAAFDATGYAIQLERKPLGTSFDLAAVEPPAIIDDSYAAKKLIELIGREKLCKTPTGELLVFNDETGLWQEGAKADVVLAEYVHRYKAELVFDTEDANGNPKVVNYGGMLMHDRAMRAKLPPQIRAMPSFIESNMETSRDKLLWADGIYDFKTDTFTPGFDPAVVFPGRIDRPYPATRDDAAIAYVHKTLFEEPFEPGQEDVVKFFKIALATGLAGQYRRKQAYMLVGQADCSKGTINIAMKEAFPEYCGVFEVASLFETKNPPNNKFLWLFERNNLRLNFGNEASMNGKADGNMIKMIASGGDQIPLRGHNKLFEDSTIRSTFFMFFNDIPAISSMTDDLIPKLKIIRFPCRFVVKDPTQLGPNERVADPDVKDKLKLPANKDALFHILVDAYKAMQQDGHVVPAGVAKATKAWTKDNTVRGVLEERYEITGTDADRVAVAEINALLKDANLGISKKATKEILLGEVGLTEGHTSDGHARAYKGIRRLDGPAVVWADE